MLAARTPTDDTPWGSLFPLCCGYSLQQSHLYSWRTSSIFELPTNGRHCVIQKLASAVYTESITTNIYLCRRCGVRHAACSRPTTGWIATRTSTPCMRCSSENGSSTSCSLRLTETYIRTWDLGRGSENQRLEDCLGRSRRRSAPAMIKGSSFVISSSGSSCSPTLTGKSKICCDEDDVVQYRHVSEFFILLYVNVPYNPAVQLIATALPLCQ